MMTSKVTKNDLKKTMWRSCGCSFSWGYERQGNIAYAYAMIPVLKKLYDTKEKMSEALKRHMEYYNVTNQCMRSILKYSRQKMQIIAFWNIFFGYL